MAAAQQAEIESLRVAEDRHGAYLVSKSLLASSGRFDDAQLVIKALNRIALDDAKPRPSDRELAVGNNNVASALYATEGLDTPAHNELMMACAFASLTFWKKCGTWINEVRGLYLLLLVSNRLHQYGRALEYAVSALGVIDANGGEPVEECFIRLAAAHAQSGLSDEQGYEREIARADAIAVTWCDAPLIAEYQRERSKALSQLP